MKFTVSFYLFKFAYLNRREDSIGLPKIENERGSRNCRVNKIAPDNSLPVLKTERNKNHFSRNRLFDSPKRNDSILKR